ncbi:MAG: glycosyltransferase family 1 protein [Chloroflexi bacterium]|nr:glycosyltransferase family 1 protein [Chloroflexota bacterium]
MADHRLFENLTRFDPGDIDRVFGAEFALRTPADGAPLAAVRRVALFAEAFLPKVDGVSKTAFLTLRYLQQTGREALVFAPDIAIGALGNTRVVRFPSLGFPKAPETRMAFPHPQIIHEIRAFQPDLIHLFSPALMSVSGMLLGRALGIPVIANYQTDLPGYAPVYGFPAFTQRMTRDWLRFLHNGCHLTLAPSHFTLRQLRRAGYKRLRHWGRGVDNERFQPLRYSPQMRTRLLNGRDPQALLCLYVGRLAAEKRVDLLVEVARTPGVALTIVGDGALREDLERIFADTATHFTGYMYGEELAQAYASADVFLFTGPNETFGQVVQEAMASGLPSVVIDQGGAADLVQQGVSGFICPPHPGKFAEYVRRLRDDAALRRSMARAARRAAENKPWEALMAQLEDYYREALDMNARLHAIAG